MSVVEGLKIQIHVCGTNVLSVRFTLLGSAAFGYFLVSLTSMLPLLPISLSSKLSDGSTVCSIQALYLCNLLFVLFIQAKAPNRAVENGVFHYPVGPFVFRVTVAFAISII